MIKIELSRLNDAFHLEAVNDKGNGVQFDASEEIGGSGLGMRPMQMLLSTLAGCSTIDVISILKKQREDLRDIHVTVTGEREKDKVPSLFETAHLHFKLYGKLDSDKAQKAVSLSVEKYCSVARILEKTAKVTFEVEILP
jgi:putative redox protein